MASEEFVLEFPSPRHLSLSSFYPFDLFGLGDPIDNSATAGLALRVAGLISPTTMARWRYQWRGKQFFKFTFSL
jgi:hypothetical protein